MSVSQELDENVDYRRSETDETRCAATECTECPNLPTIRIGVAVPGFPVVFTGWCTGHYDLLDLDAIQAALPEGSTVSSRVAVLTRVDFERRAD